MNDYVTIAVIAHKLGIAYPTAHRWVAVKKVVPSEHIGKWLPAVKREHFEQFAADYRAGKYDRWPR